jgi:hypothetical protein
MNKIFKLLGLLLILSFVTACSDDTLEEINKDKNNPADVPSKLIISDVITRTAFTVTGSDFAFYSSVYVEHNVGIYNQMYNAEIRAGEPISSTTYNNMWGAAYENLYNLKLIIEKTSEGGSEEGNTQVLGMAQILTAYNLAILTDLMGDVPYSEGLQPGIIFQPKLDKQEDLYNQIFTLLDNAVVNLAAETLYPSVGGQDFLFGGNVDLWTKFAKGLKARYTARLAIRNGGQWQQVIDNANSAFAQGENAAFSFNGSSTINPFYAFFTDRDYFGASQSLHEKLVSLNDPRDNAFFMPYPGKTELIFAPNGTTSQLQGHYGVSAIMAPDAPIYLMSYHEIEFLKAEAYARLNQLPEAKTALENAIKAAFAKIGLGEEDATTYFTNEVSARFDSNPLKEIMLQKYIAFFEEESIEAYNDIRRWQAMGENYITLSNPLNSSQFPQRFTYGADDVTTNTNITNAYGDGTYVYKEKVWWAGGNR